MIRMCILCVLLASAAWPALADEEAAYARLIATAAQGKIQEALAACAVVQAQGVHGIWGRRLQAACALLAMRAARSTRLPSAPSLPELVLARTWQNAHPPPAPAHPWRIGLASALVPGLGHLLLGRKQDALVAALFVWPMFGLTVWAWRRRMGPVVVFFAWITLWLWSGVVFSSVSLAERTSVEDYARWWAGLWQASGLPGRPW